MFCLLAASVQSCVSKKKYDELVSAKAATDQALAETQSQVKTLQDENQSLQTRMNEESTRLNNEIQSVRNEMATVNNQLRATQQELTTLRDEINGMFESFQAADLRVEDRDGELYLVTDTTLAYRPGSAALTSADRDAIDALANKLKSNPNIRIVVEGHADSQQYPAGSSYDNWDLSWDRAKNVASRLIRQGVSPEQIVISGTGEYKPLAPNDTPEGRSQNRTVKFKPNPALGSFINAMGGDMDTEDSNMNNMNNTNMQPQNNTQRNLQQQNTIRDTNMNMNMRDTMNMNMQDTMMRDSMMRDTTGGGGNY